MLHPPESAGPEVLCVGQKVHQDSRITACVVREADSVMKADSASAVRPAKLEVRHLGSSDLQCHTDLPSSLKRGRYVERGKLQG